MTDQYENNLIRPSAKPFFRNKNVYLVALTLISVVLFLIISNMVVKNFVIGKVLSNLVLLESDGKYKLEIEELDYDLISSDLRLDNFAFQSIATKGDSGEIPSHFGISAKYVELDLFNFFELVYSKKIEFRQIFLKNPEIIIKGDFPQGKSDNDTISGSGLGKVLKNLLRKGTVKELLIENGKYIMMEKEHPNTEILGIEDLDIKILNFEIEHLLNASINDFFFKTFEFNVCRCRYFDKKTFYSFQIDSLNISSEKNSFILSGLDIVDTKRCDSNDLFQIHIPEIQFNGLILDSVLHKKEFLSRSITIRKPEIEIVEKIIPSYEQKKKDDSHIEKASPFIIRIDSLIVENANCHYESINDSVHFKDLNLLLLKVNLDSLKGFTEFTSSEIGSVRLHANDMLFKSRKSNENIKVSSIFIDENSGGFEISGFEFLKEVFHEGKKSAVINLEIPSIILSDPFLRSKLKEQNVDIDELIIKKPHIKFFHYAEIENHKVKKSHFLPKFIKRISWNKFFIIDGSIGFFVLDSIEDVNSELLTNISLVSKGGFFEVTNNETDELDFDATEFDLKLSEFSFVQLHESIDVKFDTLLYVFQEDDLKLLDLIFLIRHQANQTSRIKIKEFRISDFEPVKLFEGKHQSLGEISILNPDIVFYLAKLKETKEKKPGNEKSKYNEMIIEGLNVLNGKINLFQDGELEKPLFSGSLNKLSIKSFLLDEILSGTISGEFVDNIQLDLCDVNTCQFPGHSIDINAISLRNCNLLFSGVKVVNDSNKTADIKKSHNQLSMVFPEIFLSIDKFQNNIKDSLLLNVVGIVNPEIRIVDYYKSEKSDIGKSEKKAKKKSNYVINIKDFHVDTSIIVFKDFKNEKHLELTTAMNLKVNGFRVDLNDPVNSSISSYGDGTNFFKLSNGKISSSSLNVDYGKVLIGAENEKISINSDQLYIKIVENKRDSNVFYVPGISVSGLDIKKFIDNKDISIDEFLLSKPEVNLYRNKNISGQTAQLKPHNGFVLKEINFINIGKFKIDKAGINICSIKDSVKTDDAVENIDLTINEIKINCSDTIRLNESLSIEDVDLNIPGGDFLLSDSLYTLSYRNLNFSYSKDKIEIDSLVLSPNFEKKAFFDRIGHQSDRMNISIHKILCQGINYQELYKGAVEIEAVDLESFVLQGYRDKSYPFPESQRRKLPISMLRSMKFPLSISAFSISKGHIAYAEHVEGSLDPGEIFLSDLNCSISNISNAKHTKFSSIDTMTLSLSTYLMGQGYLNANIDFPLQYEQDTFHLNAVLHEMDLTHFSDMTKNLFGVVIKKGRGRAEYLKINGNNLTSNGSMYMPYKKLKISMYNRYKGKKRGVGSSILAFLANELIIKSNNPRPLGKKRVGEIYASRDIRKSFFNFVWKSSLSGIETTLGFENKQIRKHNKEIKK